MCMERGRPPRATRHEACRRVRDGPTAAGAEPHCRLLTERLRALRGGGVTGFACSPARPDSALVVTGRGFGHVDFARPARGAADAERGAGKKRSRLDHRPEAEAARAALPGQNARVLPLEDPLLFLGYVDEKAALVVECPWSRALEAAPEPIFRRPYGA